MKFLILSMLLLSTVVFGEDKAELEQNIARALRARQAKSGIKVLNSTFFGVDEESYLKALVKIDEIIPNLRYLKSFRKVNRLNITSENKHRFSEGWGLGTLYLPASYSTKKLIEALSSRPMQEPMYLEIYESIKAKVDKLMGKWTKLNSSGRDLLCEFGDDTRPWEDGLGFWNSDSMRFKIEALIGKRVNKVQFHSSTPDNNGYSSKQVILSLENKTPLNLLLMGIFGEIGLERFSVQLNQNETMPSAKRPLFGSWYDIDCSFRGAKTFHYENGKISFRKWFGPEAKEERKVFVDRDVMPLQAIYKSSKDLEKAKTITSRSDRVILAVLDGGVDYNHPLIAYKIHNRVFERSQHEAQVKKQEQAVKRAQELEKELSQLTGFTKWMNENKLKHQIFLSKVQAREPAHGWDFQDDDGRPYDYEDIGENPDESFVHGTHVAGIATQNTDDISILPIRCSYYDKKTYLQAVDLAYEKGARIMNVSRGNIASFNWEHLKKAMNSYPDMLFVVAAGNHGESLDEVPIYPASYALPYMLVVTSVSEENKLSEFSAWSDRIVDIAAFGEDVLSSMPEQSYERLSGTSMATPQVSRVAAKIKFINPRLTIKQIKNIILESATFVDSLTGKVRTSGVLNESAALEMARATI